MRVRNLLALSRTQVNLADTGPLHLQPRTVAAGDRSTQSSGANRRPSRCEAFPLPHLEQPVPRWAVPVLREAGEMRRPRPAELALLRGRWKVAPAFRRQPSGHGFDASAASPKVARSTA